MKYHRICLLYMIFLLSCDCQESQDEFDFGDEIKEDLFDMLHGITLPIRELINEPVAADKIIYYLFNSSSPQNYTILDDSNADILSKSAPIAVFIHGWIQDRNVEWYGILKNLFFELDSQYLIIQVDWSVYSKQNYYTAQNASSQVGAVIGEFVASLIEDYSIPLENFLILSHSMGAHIGGFVGKRVSELLDKKLQRLICFDPAGPLYENRKPDERLAPTDAEVVHVIHTDGKLGFSGNCGTIDFRPNGGNVQPGCLDETIKNLAQINSNVTCNHNRCWRYFAEGMQATGKFVSRKCRNYLLYRYFPFFCSSETEELASLVTRKTGSFFLKTNSKAPYSKQ